MIPRSLGGRLLSAFALLALAIVIAVGGALFVALRGLHQDATLNTLSDVVGSVLPQVRDAIGTGQLRGTVLELRDQIAERGYQLVIVGADGHIRSIEGTSFAGVVVDGDMTVGAQSSGSFRLQDGPYLYVATGLMLSEVLNATGQARDANQVLTQTKQIAKAVQLTDLLAQLEQPEMPLPESNPLLIPRGDTQRSHAVPAKP